MKPQVLTQQQERDWEEQFSESHAHRVARNATTSVGIHKAARVPEVYANTQFSFTIDLSQGERCDQQRSGRCWLFASLNVLRQRVIQRYNLKTWEFSQSYAMFYDKLEKANLFFHNMLSVMDEPVEGRTMSYLLADPFDDGGQWDMFCNIVRKYGVVPKDAMPETACSRNTRELDEYLTRYIRSCALKMRRMHADGATEEEILAATRPMLHDVYNILVTCLGEPPRKFDVILRDKDDKVCLEGTYTPQQFFEEVIGFDLSEFISVIHAPTKDKPMGRLFTVNYLGNVVEDGFVKHLNLPIEVIKKAAIAQLSDGWPVWFGCDVGKTYDRDEGILSHNLLAIDDLFGCKIVESMSKEEALNYYDSAMTHAMVFEGVKLDREGKPQFWKVENSWGKDHGDHNGFDIMSDQWFDAFVFQVVLNKKYLPAKTLKESEASSPIMLEPWDPMGTLAR